MTIDHKIRNEEYNITLTKKQQKQYYHQVKLIKVNIVQLKKYWLLIKVKLYNKLNLLIRQQKKLLKY